MRRKNAVRVPFAKKHLEPSRLPLDPTLAKRIKSEQRLRIGLTFLLYNAYCLPGYQDWILRHAGWLSGHLVGAQGRILFGWKL